MNNPRANLNLLAVSANAKETALNTEQTLDTTLLCSVGDLLALDPRREDNANEANGKEEPDTIYHLGGTSNLGLNFEKMQPQHLAFIAAFGLGSVVTSGAGSGYEHHILPLDGDVDASRSLPTFTAAQRYGQTLGKRRCASMAIDQFTATFAADAWAKLTAQAKGTGKVEHTMYRETLTAKDDAVSLTLAANGVQGATAAARLDNVHQIQVELASGVWTEVAYSAVSVATPAVITITPPGAATTDVSYRILYTPTEPAWATFPARVSETPLRVAEMTVVLGGAWNGSAFVGGRNMSSLVNSLEWSLQNNLQVEFAPGAGGNYASRIFRDGRVQTLKLDREMRDWCLQYLASAATVEYFGVRVLCEGAVFDSPHKYQVEIIFPRVAVLNAPMSVNGKRLAEAGDLKVLEDDTYGSVLLNVKNVVEHYAA